MSDATSQPESETECAKRSRCLDRKLAFLWIPGRRAKLAAESFALGQTCRQHGYTGLAEANFRRVGNLYQDARPTKKEESLKTFGLVAASHNHLGLLNLDAERPVESRPFFDRAIELRQELSRLFPQDRENQVYLGGALCNRAHAIADTDAAAAIELYHQSLSVLRQPDRLCECSYWDEQRQSWWCEQLEAMADALGLQWVFLAPKFIDNAVQGLKSVEPPAA